MSVHIGYACMVVGETGMKISGCRLKNATEKKLREIASANLQALERMIDYNAERGIRLFRISSDIIPFASHPAADFGWQEEFAGTLERIGRKIKDAGLRVSMHPGQYTVLNSPDTGVARNALLDLEYHADFLDALGAGRESKIILHAGGAYGDKQKAMERFVLRAQGLPDRIKGRIALENDDANFTAGEILKLSVRTGFPAVFDNLHNELNPSEERLSEREWILRFAGTWSAADGRQKVHYSQPGFRRGAHSKTIGTARFLEFYQTIENMEIDVMLEVKDKNLSAVKCVNAARGAVPAAELEREWARYKYLVLSRSASAYNAVRTLLKRKGMVYAAAFYALLDGARALPPDSGAKENAAQHIWGYFKKDATEREKKRYAALMEAPGTNEASLKRFLLKCAQKYNQAYLLQSYYFYVD